MREREEDGYIGHDQARRTGRDGRREEMALTVGQGVALKPIQVLLLQHLGQVTAVDESGLTNGNEATDQGDEECPCHHRWRGGGAAEGLQFLGSHRLPAGLL